MLKKYIEDTKTGEILDTSLTVQRGNILESVSNEILIVLAGEFQFEKDFSVTFSCEYGADNGGLTREMLR